MALTAAGINESQSELGKWLGSVWWQTIMALGGSLLITTLLGCTGACYQNKIALILYIVIMILEVVGSAAIIFLASSSELDRYLEDSWMQLNDRVKQDIITQAKFDCTLDDTASCVAEAREKANEYQRNIAYICGGTMLYQITMIIFTINYIKGLKKKTKRITELKDDRHRMEIALSPNVHLEEVEEKEYKNIKHI
eukprot:CAMPEP_0202693030 /NCGR_PEP_ID=MMETSP1385-20130828/7254_1 /ASSEMBLY_ACC=CAM_ASM_000861 /TAXON_ID=933848 /ORGANISM="Elphidium margaritaceum" /LENGTH=195 /DNA_ID=CAMNT_0049348657 /DNA_START=200 /DNA_END=787 /DNA_ORIENTATION=-